jgi:hypothetical protein
MPVRIGLRTCAVVCASLLPAALPAASMSIQPRVSAGLQNYSMGFEDVISPLSNGGLDFIRDGFEVGDLLPFVGAGVTLTRGRLFLDLSGQWSRNGHDATLQRMSTEIDKNGNTSPAVVGAVNVFGQTHRIVAEFDRSEYNATLGWAFTANFSTYAGFKRASSDMTQATQPDTAPPPSIGDVLFFGDYAMEFSYDGFFLGATYSLPVGNWGAFALQSSIARLDGEFSEKFAGTAGIFVSPISTLPINPSFRDGTVDGESTGFNIGLSFTGSFGWLSPALEGLSYTIGVDRSLYKFDSGKSRAFWAADFEETNTRARVDLRYRLPPRAD